MLFEEKINNLNDAQRSAVEATEGPVMVIAGPGTGKTEILSLRIGYILKHTDTPPGSILCLTYTDAAATEMRQRLIQYIGPEAYRLQVSTFHSFCNLVIQENPSYFQQARELEPISEIDKFKLLQQLIDEFGPDHPLKKFKGNTYSDWKRLDELFSTMKKENWSPEYMYRQIEEYIAQKRESDEFIYKRKSGDFNKGDLKIKDFTEKVLDRMEVLKAAVGEYDHFNAMLVERGQYDFDDMLLWVHKAFSQFPDLLANYQERFLYFLVDEFQDTNGIQIAILQKLIDHEWLDRPNIFVVGDDDQAIYRFQGANIENLVDFQRRYDPAVIFLDKNYRSSQRILDASRVVMNFIDNSLMQQLFNQVKTLEAAGTYRNDGQQVILQSNPSLSYENAEIFHQLKAWHETQTQGEIAVLYPKHELGRELAQALKGAGIPFHSQKRLDSLQHPLVQHLLTILSCIHQLSDGADNDDALLYQTLHLRYLEPKPRDLQKLMLLHTVKGRDETNTFFALLGNAEKLNEVELQNRSWIDEIYQLLEKAIIEYHSRTLVSFVEWIVHAFGIMKWILHQPEKFTQLYVLKTFYHFAESQAMGQPMFKVPDLLELCELMATYKIQLPVQELAHAGKGIHLSSLHGAKGLEFEKVIIKNITENEWEKKRAFQQSFTYPDNLIRQESFSSIESDATIKDQDRRRLLYVGMTRAKQELVLSYANAKDDGKGLIPSVYLTELETQYPEIQRSKISPNEALLAEYNVAYMSGEQTADLQKDEDEIRSRVQNLVLNATALNAYLECPLRFYYEKILLIPATQRSYLIFGSALHDALQKIIDRRFKQKDELAGKEFFIRAFELYMRRHEYQFTEKEYTNQVTYGRKVLSQFYDYYSPKWSADTQYETEYRIRDVHVEGIPITGFIDRLEKTGDMIRVIDYKSGKTTEFSKKLKRPDEANPNGGAYWRQMVFYDLLLMQDQRIRQPMFQGSLIAIEPEKDGKFVEKNIMLTEEDRDLVTEQIKTTWDKIQRLEFEKGCGECEWCRMHDLNPPLVKGDEEDVGEG